MFSVPMNKIVVGSAPSPNLMSAQSRIGSLANTQHRVSGFYTSIIIVKYVNSILMMMMFSAWRGQRHN